MLMYLGIGIFIAILISGFFLVLKFSKEKTLSNDQIIFFHKTLKKYVNNIDSKSKIVDLDKLYHKILQGVGYKGTFGEILKMKPEEVKDLNKIWELHKLRNKLVHDFDLLEEKVLKQRAQEYEREVGYLLKRVS